MPPPASDLAIYRAFRDDLLACGVPQVSIEPQIGRSGRWVSRGPHGGTSFVACLGHHIASSPTAARPTPGLSVVKNGRTGLAAPLANAYGGMDLIARILCLDWANHPGEGGPWTINGFRIPRDGGRPYLLGWEHEGGFSTAVWDAVYTNKATGRGMTYREFMGRCHAGTLRFLSRPRTSFGEHSTWADLKQRGRKIDRLGYGHPVGTPASRGINELTPYYLNPEDDMAPPREWTSTDWAAFRKGFMSMLVNHPIRKGDTGKDAQTTMGTALRWWQWAPIYNTDGKTTKILTIVTALLDAHENVDTAAVLARINEIAEQESAERQELAASEAARDAQLLTLAEEIAEGRTDAAAIINALRAIVHDATAPPEPTGDPE